MKDGRDCYDHQIPVGSKFFMKAGGYVLATAGEFADAETFDELKRPRLWRPRPSLCQLPVTGSDPSHFRRQRQRSKRRVGAATRADTAHRHMRT